MENQSDFIGFESSSESEISDGEITIIKPTPKAQDTSIKSVDPLTRLPTNPWVKPNRKYSSNLITKLDQEIRDFDKFIHPTVAEHQMRLFTINRLRKLVHTIFDIDSDLKCFGSFETKLYLPSSDLDMVIINPRLHKPNCLYALEEGLKKYNISSQIDVIARSKVPIVKYVDNITNFPVDVSFNMENGVKSCKVVESVVKDPVIGDAIQILMMLIKQFLVQRHLNEVFSGGIGSYSLLWMITSFLKLHPRIQSCEIDPLNNIGILLVEFFELYGKNFNFEKVGISLNPHTPYFKRSYEQRPSLLSILDPQDETNNVSVGSYNFQSVKWAFNRAFMVLTTIIGAGYEHRLQDPEFRQIPDEDDRMLTILGNILTIERKVLEQRDFIEIQYEKYIKGELKLDIFKVQDNFHIPELQKRKRDQEVIFIEDTEDESEELPRKKLKRKSKNSDDVNHKKFQDIEDQKYSKSRNGNGIESSDFDEPDQKARFSKGKKKRGRTN